MRIPKVYDGQDKTFFFFNYDQFISHTLTGNGLITVPTAAYQEGDFSAASESAVAIRGRAPSRLNGTALFGNQIFDPNTPDG